MKKVETIEDLYKRRPNDKMPDWSAAVHNGYGHFNVFLRADYACRSITPYSRKDYYKITLLMGNGVVHYADRSIEVSSPALLFSNPTVPYSWEATDEVQDGYFCLFTESFIRWGNKFDRGGELPLFKAGGDPLFFLGETQVQRISGIFLRMFEERDSEYVYKYELLRSYVDLLIHEALKLKPADTYFRHANASSRISSLFLELLERQFPIDTPQNNFALKTAKDYAGKLSVHVNHLNRAVKETTGKTTTEHIAERITQEAKALLKHTDWNISEIGYALGFEYPAYFNNFFKKQTSTTPKSFRN
ncbi:helix-turn-helix domain-containing protein [Taibaiella soli]|uniref:AraC family transcriptional regulator n=1 Tax=Taibaiella soli TaxID=1649169 RepID=A0A2W2B631_9BACT|nr:helix-turn-helix transcriptional regulator [Taibaiella soli]PZF71669.1 AraC family transcriptional regulator [Taibaiella soli]